jgi:type VI secretion system secreted protein Hcp
MAFDAFLKIEGIDGESQDKDHKNEIEIDSFSWGVTNPSTGGGGRGGGGRAMNQDFHFIAPVSKASPSLMLACCTGRHFATATLTCRKAGTEFEKIELFDVLVSSYSPSGDTHEDRPEDSFTLNFHKIDFLYAVAKTGEMVEATFDFG